MHLVLGKDAQKQKNIDLSLSNHQNETIQIYGASSGDYFGYSIAEKIKINHDKCSSLMISASFASDNSRINSGTTYVIFGNFTELSLDLAKFNNAMGIKIYGANDGDYSGYSLASAGDFNNDGKQDITIASPFASPNSRANAGIIYVLHGLNYSIDIDLAEFNNNLGIKIFGAKANDNLGNIVKYVGDVNSDGCGDIILGLSLSSYLSRNKCGKSHVLWGAISPKDIDLASLAPDDGIVVIGANSLDYSGISVNSAGDFNRDGYEDFVIGAYGASPNSKTKSGSSYVVYGGYNTPTSQPSNQPSNQPSRHPSAQPSRQPSAQPSEQPSEQPTDQPSNQPSRQPTAQPSGQPTAQPSRQPTAQPSRQPSGQPSRQPTVQPSAQPVLDPTSVPTSKPTREPSGSNTKKPTIAPTIRPTIRPSIAPSPAPSINPTHEPTLQPIDRPTSYPSSQPTGSPSSQPSSNHQEAQALIQHFRLQHQRRSLLLLQLLGQAHSLRANQVCNQCSAQQQFQLLNQVHNHLASQYLVLLFNQVDNQHLFLHLQHLSLALRLQY